MATEGKSGIKTTTIGSYPKPDYATVAGWFDLRELHRRSPTRTYSALLRERSHDTEELLHQATREVVREQAEIGIDIPTDGEVHREHYIYYHLRHIEGFDFDNLTVATMRNGNWEAEVPTVVRPLQVGPPFLARDWRVAQSSTDRPVKITVPGPLTIIDSTTNAFYASDQDLAFALADVLAVEISIPISACSTKRRERSCGSRPRSGSIFQPTVKSTASITSITICAISRVSTSTI